MIPDREEKIARLRLWRTPRIGAATYADLLDRFGTAQAALDQVPQHRRARGLQRLAIPDRGQVIGEIEALNRMGGRFLFADAPEFPALLRQIPDCPPLIATLGNTALLQRPCLAVVGARNASLNGKSLARTYAQTLGEAGFVVVSGLARGIDAAAHTAALPTGTIAVVAGGLDVIYPRENADLHGLIAADGLILSEQPLGMPTSARLFPLRNRLVSGLSYGTLVVEANDRSGSLITARLAGEQGREVMAVPGSPLEGRADGTNRLIRQGATLIGNRHDLIEGLSMLAAAQGLSLAPADPARAAPDRAPHPKQPSQRVTQATEQVREASAGHAGEVPLSAQIKEALSVDPISLEALTDACTGTAAAIQAVLGDLEVRGEIVRHPGGLIALAP